MQLLGHFVIVTVSLLSIVAAQSCMLPSQTEIEGTISELLQNSDASNTDPVTISSFQYTCQVQGDRRDTYRQLSVIASYTNRQVEDTRHFQLQCQGNDEWDPRLSEGLQTPPNNYQSLSSTRTNCRQCAEGFGDHHCRPCNPTCPGSGRCPTLGECCSYFATDGTCTNNCTEADGINYIGGTVSNNFMCTCNITCDPGYIADDNCTQCVLNDICMADNPCQNGGTCTLLSSPDSYTCNCTGTGYIGVNCTTVCNLTCTNGYIPNDNCNQCILNNTCTADNPCQNGGICTLLSSPDSYLCNCSTGTGYTGVNCTVCSLTCKNGYIPNDNCTQCILNDTCIADNPCQNGGTCTLLSSPDTYTCNCAGTGFTGVNCTDAVAITTSMSPTSTTSMSPTSATSMSLTVTLIPSQRPQGLAPGSLAGIIISIFLGILLLLSLATAIAYLIYYFMAGRPAKKNKDVFAFPNSKLQDNPLYLPPEEIAPSNTL